MTRLIELVLLAGACVLVFVLCVLAFLPFTTYAATATTTAARVTPGVAYMEAQEAQERLCDRWNATSEVTGVAEYRCYSSRILRRTCTIVIPRGSTTRPFAVCRGVMRHGMYAPGGIDSMWNGQPPCWRFPDGFFGWAHWRAKYAWSVYSTRRATDAFASDPRCKTLRNGNEA